MSIFILIKVCVSYFQLSLGCVQIVNILKSRDGIFIVYIDSIRRKLYFENICNIVDRIIIFSDVVELVFYVCKLYEIKDKILDIQDKSLLWSEKVQEERVFFLRVGFQGVEKLLVSFGFEWYF